MSRAKLIVILGPTASGKSELAVRLALRLRASTELSRMSSGQSKKRFRIKGVEIISADSRQVYKEMDIGTAKPLTRRIPHYLIDVVRLNEEFNVAIYKRLAIKKIREIQKRKKIPFLVGGTGLYIKSIVDNLNFPKVIPQKKLREKLEKKSTKVLFKIYQKLDPKGAKIIDKGNKRRLIRAIEVCQFTKIPFSKQKKEGRALFDVLEIGIKIDKKELDKRISKRVDKMIKMGLENEVKSLVKKYSWKTPALQAIGYQEWCDYFQGKIKKNEVKEKIKLHTRQFTKRQMTWFKSDKRIEWIKTRNEAINLIRKFLEDS